jgi:5-hydroxyisourate hydrolase-like protein (transthyretin family)
LIVSGSGRAIINNGEISEVKVLNTGIGYSASNTKIQVVSSGKNSFIDPQIRKLTLNDNITRFTTGEVLLEGKDKLQYSVSKYFENLRNSFKENPTSRLMAIQFMDPMDIQTLKIHHQDHQD